MHFGNSTALPIGPKKLSHLVLFSFSMQEMLVAKPNGNRASTEARKVSSIFFTYMDEVMRIRGAVKGRLQACPEGHLNSSGCPLKEVQNFSSKTPANITTSAASLLGGTVFPPDPSPLA
ncbi:hypothetical protein B0H17DRAFT_1136040 [Mycena rosella]|uniref:Uncharacterized protein n=1 Tax=Mycena rosella TaxID=1033263 RepID=A0AAD7GEY8_MYCRO|nr:hypothetical protein B0H17DRAFT_1136040 [Mycena rosella]